MWVRSEYAGELAVLSTWLCALLPWAVSYRTLGEFRLYRLHFHYAFLQFVPGADLGQALDPFVAVYDGPGFPADPTTTAGYQWWLVGAAAFTLVLAWSVVYYVYDERLETRSPVDPVRVTGGLLVAVALALTASTYYVSSGFSGTTVPVGLVFIYLFGGLLLVVERASATRD
jgi:uncharacterized protein (TIGR04206 family)